MNEKRTFERGTEFVVMVKHYSDNSVQVTIKADDCMPIDLMCATEYMIWTYTRQSGLSFEETIRRLGEGAKTYVIAVVTMPLKE